MVMSPRQTPLPPAFRFRKPAAPGPDGYAAVADNDANPGHLSRSALPVACSASRVPCVLVIRCGFIDSYVTNRVCTGFTIEPKPQLRRASGRRFEPMSCLGCNALFEKTPLVNQDQNPSGKRSLHN